jgi:hypothetical protein
MYAVGHRPVGRNAVRDYKGQDDLGDVEVSAAEKRVALVDKIQKINAT